MSDQLIDLGPFCITTGEVVESQDWRALNGLAANLELLPRVARALDALDCAGIRVPDEHYKVALMAAVLSDDEPHRFDAFERAQRRVFVEGLQRLREQGVDIPRQPWEK